THEFPSRRAHAWCKIGPFCTAELDPYLQAHFQLFAGQELSARLRKTARAKPSGVRGKANTASAAGEIIAQNSAQERSLSGWVHPGRLEKSRNTEARLDRPLLVRQELLRFLVREALNLGQEGREFVFIRRGRQSSAVARRHIRRRWCGRFADSERLL